VVVVVVVEVDVEVVVVVEVVVEPKEHKQIFWPPHILESDAIHG